jgi:hypothetical protein
MLSELELFEMTTKGAMELGSSEKGGRSKKWVNATKISRALGLRNLLDLI